METQKTPNKNNVEKEEQSWKNHYPWLLTRLQSYGNQKSMVLVQKQTYWSMEQNREPRNKLTRLWSVKLRERRQEYTMKKRQSLQQVVLGKLESHMKQK